MVVSNRTTHCTSDTSESGGGITLNVEREV